MAKNRGEPQKMTHTSETDKKFQGGPDGKVVVPEVLVIYPVDKIRDSKTKKLTSGPKYPTFGVKIAHFRPNWSPTGQCFQHEGGVSLVP